jgi:hypothetical protein
MSTPENQAGKMNDLLERMKSTKQRMDELNYDAYVLQRQGRLSESLSKQRAAEFARGYWKRLDADYKKLWRKRRGSSASPSI